VTDCAESVSHCRQHQAFADAGTTCDCPTHAYSTTLHDRVRQQTALVPGDCHARLSKLIASEPGSPKAHATLEIAVNLMFVSLRVRRVRNPTTLLWSLNRRRSTCRGRLSYGERVRRTVQGRTMWSERSDRRFCSNHAQQSKSVVWLPAQWICAMWYFLMGSRIDRSRLCRVPHPLA
jgi:hypothetical protein